MLDSIQYTDRSRPLPSDVMIASPRSDTPDGHSLATVPLHTRVPPRTNPERSLV